MYIKHWCDFDKEPPPGPSTNSHELSNILLYATNGDVLGLENEKLNIMDMDKNKKINLRLLLPSVYIFVLDEQEAYLLHPTFFFDYSLGEKLFLFFLLLNLTLLSTKTFRIAERNL